MSDKRLIDAAHKHLGRPWNSHGFDCWECVRAIYSDALGVILPACQFSDDTRNSTSYRDAISAHSTTPMWSPIDAPVDGCVVAMGKREWPHHVGVYLDVDGGRIVHCLERVGCASDKLSTLRKSGWGFMKFYALTVTP